VAGDAAAVKLLRLFGYVLVTVQASRPLHIVYSGPNLPFLLRAVSFANRLHSVMYVNLQTKPPLAKIIKFGLRSTMCRGLMLVPVGF